MANSRKTPKVSKNRKGAPPLADVAEGGGFAIAIMAAGKGTRLKSRHPKVLHQVGGKPMLAYVVAAAARVVLPNDIYAIIGHEAELRARCRQQHGHQLRRAGAATRHRPRSDGGARCARRLTTTSSCSPEMCR